MTSFPTRIGRALALISVTAAVLLLPSGAGAAPLTIGIQSDNMLLDDAATRSAELDRLKAAGTKIIRVTLGWHRVAVGPCAAQTLTQLQDPTNACYDWTLYDDLVLQSTRRGIPLIFSVHQIPPYVLNSSNPYFMGSTERAFNTRVVPHWAAFAKAAARRYNSSSVYGNVRRWTVGNEPNSAFFWQPMNANAPKRYARLFRAVAPAIFASNSRAQVAAGPTGPRSTMKPVRWLRIALPAMQRNGSGRFLSAWSHNTYPKGTLSPRTLKTNPPSIDVTNMKDLYKELDAFRATRKKPVWVLEYAYQTNPPDRLFGVGWTNQATYLAEGFDMHNDGRTKIVIWYVSRDPANLVDWQSGLWDKFGRRKPSLAMYMRPVARSAARVRRGERVNVFGMSLARPGRQTLQYSYNGRNWRAVPGQRRSGATVRASIRMTRQLKVRTVDPAGRGPARLIRVG